MIKTDYVLPEKRNDRWMQGFVCAVCIMIELDGMVETRTREMYRAGVGQLTLSSLEKRGVDKNDLLKLEEFWYELH
jgi:hypothetical protein